MYKVILGIVMLILLAGCGVESYDNRSYDDQRDGTTLYLIDERGYSYAGIPYRCNSANGWRTTTNDGAFSFIEPDTCRFNFNGLDGLYGDNFDDVIRIVNYADSGVSGINYSCKYFGASSTYNDGSFGYDQDDICTFYL